MNLEIMSGDNLETESHEAKQEAEVKNEYDREAPENEIKNLQKEIEEKVEEKAKELGISKEKLVEVTGLDLESLEAGKLKELNLRRGDLDFIRESINEAINEFQKSNKPNIVLKDSPSKINKFLEFVGKHKKVVSVGQLALYLSSYGMPALSALAGDDAKVEIEGEKISLKDLANNPELIKEVDQACNAGTPIDILKAYSPPESFEHNENKLSFDIITKVGDDNSVGKFIFFKDISGNNYESIEKLDNDLKEIGMSLLDTKGKEKGFLLNKNNAKEGCPLDNFLKNKEQVTKIIAQDLNVPENLVEKYIENLIMPDVSKVSVVELNEFDINEDLKIPDDALKVKQKIEEVYKKYNVYSEDGIKNFENELKAKKELKQWGEKNGYEDIDSAFYEERESYENLPAVKLENLKLQEKAVAEFENADKFRDLFLESLNESGYSVEELKEIAEENPEKVIGIVSEVIGKNVEYDWLELMNLKFNKLMKELTGVDLKIKKHSEGIPYITMESEKGVCHDYAITFTAAKYVLEEEGIPNLDKFAVISTISGKMNHHWSDIVTINQDGKLVISSLDSTWADSLGGKLNAVDEKHYYSSLPEELDEAHQEALKKIGDWNNLVAQENLKKILTQYDPKLYKREHEIEEVRTAKDD